MLSLLLTLVVLLVTSPGAFAKFAALLASVVPFGLAFFAWRRAQAHAAALSSALQQAWLLAASRIVAAHASAYGSPMSALELSKVLRVDEPRAELLLAELSVRDFITPPAEVPPRMRVTELADPAELGDPAATAEPAARSDARKP